MVLTRGGYRGAIRSRSDGAATIRGMSDASGSIRSMQYGEGGSRDFWRLAPRGRGAPGRGVSSRGSNTPHQNLARVNRLQVGSDDETEPPDPSQEDLMQDDDYDDAYSDPPVDNTQGGVRVLKPDGLWFGHRRVSGGVSYSIRKHYHQAWLNWKTTPEYQKKQWWNIFKQKHTWAPEHEDEAWWAYKRVATNRLSGLVSQIGLAGKRSKWMKEEVFTELMEKRSEPGFQRRSRRASQNRRKASENGFVVGTHRNGSVSTLETVERMAKQNGGILPPPVQLFLETHTKIGDNGERIFSCERARNTMEKYERLIAHYAEQGVTKTEEEVWLEAVDGKKRGHVYGLGQSGRLYYAASSSSMHSTAPYPSSTVSQLQRQLSTYAGEMDTMRSRLVEMESRQAEIAEMDSIKAQLEEARRAQAEQKAIADALNKKMEMFEAALREKHGGSFFDTPTD